MKNVLVAGATGYLGRYLVKELSSRGYMVRVLSRNAAKAVALHEYAEDVFLGEITQPNSLESVCEGMDAVISSIGITRQKDGLTYMDVDYQGNKNLLDEAVKHRVSKFIYVSVINADQMMNLKAIKAKERFVEELKNSGLEYTIMRPTGFFSDMLEFLKMAEKGSLPLFGSGENHINPIHGADLAAECVSALHRPEKEINIGGPETFTYRKIGELAFYCIKKRNKDLNHTHVDNPDYTSISKNIYLLKNLRPP